MVLFSFIWLPDNPVAQKYTVDGKFRFPLVGMAFYKENFGV